MTRLEGTPPCASRRPRAIVRAARLEVNSLSKSIWFGALGVALAALGCASKAPPPITPAPVLPEPIDAGSLEEDSGPNDAGPVQSAPLPPAENEQEVGARWFEALRRADPALLDDWTRYPFFLHDTGDEGTCGQGAAADASQLTMLLGCILHNEALLTELRSQPEPAVQVVPAKDLPAWARRWRNEAAKDATLLLIEISGHGNATRFVLVVREGRVEAAWKQTVFGTN